MATLAEALAIARAQQQAGHLGLAVEIYRRILSVDPEHAEALNNLGNLLKDQGDLNGAIDCYRRAIAISAGWAEMHSNLGAALHLQGKIDEAIPCYQRALQLKPNHADAYNNLGVALQALGQPAEAADCFQRAAELKVGNAQALNNLGNIWLQQGQAGQAAACYRQTLAANPRDAEAFGQLGRALHLLGQLDEALACYRQSLALRPNHAGVYNNLGHVLRDTGQPAEALAAYRHAVELAPDWPALGSSLVYGMQFCPESTPQAILAAHRRWNEQHAAPLATRTEPHGNDRTPDRRLRVGYVSPDFRRHVVGLNLLPLFRHHDPREEEVFCYADVTQPDAVTEQLQSCADVWRNGLALSDERLAEQIRADRIDVLVDLTLHMHGNRLLVFARQPAPVQVTFAGYPGTTGLTAMGYRLTDPYLDPPGMTDAHYSERSIRLPESFWCYQPLADDPPVNALPAGTQEWVTLGCLANFCKVNEAVLNLWAAVLRAVDRSKLVMLSAEGSHRQRVLDLFAQRGVAPERVSFVGHQPRAEYLKTYHRIDLGLDTFPYNGHTTSLDAFWMGVPVVTLVGQTAVGRGGLSILTNLGLHELAAHDAEHYVQIAAALAGDRPRLAELRQTLRTRMKNSPLMDAARFARNVEAAYRSIWRHWCRGEGAGG
jgi:predicted O-linked N-acetylglucosamine transferase (SPINDLY family)